MEKGKKQFEKLRSEGHTNVEAIQIDVSDPQSIVAARNN